MKRWVGMVLVLFLLLMTGCRGAESTEPVEPVEDEPTVEEPTIEPEKPMDFTQAERLLDIVMDAINRQDAEQLLMLADRTWPGYFSLQQMEASLADYAVMTGGEPLMLAEELGPDPYAQNMTHFVLKTHSGRMVPMDVVLRDGEYKVSDPVIYYAAFKNQRMDRYMEAISRENTEELARAYYLDDSGTSYPLELAEDLLEQYRRAFDLQTLSWRFTGQFDENRAFLIAITGTKDSQPVLHEIRVIWGDGQVGLVDEWAQPFN